ELTFLRVVVEAGRFGFLAPAFDLVRRFLFAIGVEPFRHLLIARAVLDLRFEIGAFDSFETEQRVIERTIEVVFADVARDQRRALVYGAAENGVTADPN